MILSSYFQLIINVMCHVERTFHPHLSLVNYIPSVFWSQVMDLSQWLQFVETKAMKSPHFTAVSPGEFFFDEPVDLRTIISYGFIWIHMVASIEILWIPMVSRCIPYCGMGIFPFFFLRWWKCSRSRATHEHLLSCCEFSSLGMKGDFHPWKRSIFGVEIRFWSLQTSYDMRIFVC